MIRKTLVAAGLAALLISPALLAATPPAGEVTMLTGKGTASTPQGAMRGLAKGGKVQSGELLHTGPNSYMNVKFRDGGMVLLRPNSRFEIEKYEYRSIATDPLTTAPAQGNPPARQEGLAFRLLRGGFRAVTGLLGKTDRSQYQVRAGTATIGIRGTDYSAILCDAACALDPVIQAGLPPGANGEGALLVTVDEGGVIVRDVNGVEHYVEPGKYLLAMPDGSVVWLPGPPDFLKDDPIPDPEDCD